MTYFNDLFMIIMMVMLTMRIMEEDQSDHIFDDGVMKGMVG